MPPAARATTRTIGQAKNVSTETTPSSHDLPRTATTMPVTDAATNTIQYNHCAQLGHGLP